MFGSAENRNKERDKLLQTIKDIDDGKVKFYSQEEIKELLNNKYGI